MLYVAAVLNLSAGVLVAAGGRQAVAGRRRRSAARGPADADGHVRLRRLFPAGSNMSGQDVIYHGLSPYGSLVVTKSGGQLTFIENGSPLFSTENVGTSGRDGALRHGAASARPVACC